MTQPSPPPPVISVVVPAHRAGATIGGQLAALARQQVDVAWEVVVVIADGAPLPDGPRPPRLRVLTDGCPSGPGHARNVGVAAAEGAVIAFCDADDEVSPGWLAAMLDALVHHPVVAGAASYDELNSQRVLDDYGYRRGRPIPSGPAVERGFLPFAETYSCAVRREAFEDVGGFDEGLRTAEDVDLSFRLQQHGYALGYAPDAVVHRRLRVTRRAQMLQQLQWARGDTGVYRRHRPMGMPPAGRDGGVWAWGRLVRDVPQLASPRRRGRWLQVAAARIGRLIGSAQNRVWYP